MRRGMAPRCPRRRGRKLWWPECCTAPGEPRREDARAFLRTRRGRLDGISNTVHPLATYQLSDRCCVARIGALMAHQLKASRGPAQCSLCQRPAVGPAHFASGQPWDLLTGRAACAGGRRKLRRCLGGHFRRRGDQRRVLVETGEMVRLPDAAHAAVPGHRPVPGGGAAPRQSETKRKREPSCFVDVAGAAGGADEEEEVHRRRLKLAHRGHAPLRMHRYQPINFGLYIRQGTKPDTSPL
ncbi:hypothetical protein SETIT_3G099100v2 [Setaria italica]|uniref:Uncharacterized protein n=1 Tax=Setaria italica TaxID=4555 RepID=A0A368QD93_SETIT|nr:hypothetical protein SETIT_3G099100v2 [Setaria italica]